MVAIPSTMRNENGKQGAARWWSERGAVAEPEVAAIEAEAVSDSDHNEG